ncbi:MAG TPA: TetR/AcrR family transcriptional regulator, partial [Novosphingobium sp.]
AARGYHGATTREIARLADVSETLLFRYYGTKAALFDEVVAQPFNRLIQAFVEHQRDSTDPEADAHYIFRAVYEMIERNRDLFAASLSAPASSCDSGGGPTFDGFRAFFRTATAEQLKKYTDRGTAPGFDLGLGLRLTFGMLASSILLSDWLFPDGPPPRDAVVGMLEGLVMRALDPPARGD